MAKSISILGCGWLGFPLAKKLIEEGYTVRGSVRTNEKCVILEDAGIHPFIIDIEAGVFTAEFLVSEILIIAIPSKDIQGFRKLIAQISKSAVKRVLFISSTSVYDPHPNPINETAPTNNNVLSQIEKLFLSASDFDSSIVRFAGLMGYNRQPGNFFPEGRLIKNPEGRVNMIHRDDCIALIYDLIKQGKWGEIFNACADLHPKRKDFYSFHHKKIGRIPPEFDVPSKTELKVIDATKIKSVLNYQFIYPDLMTEGLP